MHAGSAAPASPSPAAASSCRDVELEGPAGPLHERPRARVDDWLDWICTVAPLLASKLSIECAGAVWCLPACLPGARRGAARRGEAAAHALAAHLAQAAPSRPPGGSARRLLRRAMLVHQASLSSSSTRSGQRS
jgi:hypothetical protein